MNNFDLYFTLTFSENSIRVHDLIFHMHRQRSPFDRHFLPPSSIGEEVLETPYVHLNYKVGVQCYCHAQEEEDDEGGTAATAALCSNPPTSSSTTSLAVVMLKQLHRVTGGRSSGGAG